MSQNMRQPVEHRARKIHSSARKKVNKKVQEEPQAEAAANPPTSREEKK